MFSYSIPVYEIHLQNEPVAMIYLPGRKIQFYKMKPIGKYFVIKTKKVTGVFELKGTPNYIGKTPIFQFDMRNSIPFDPIVVDELNKYLTRNQLTKLKQKDKKHGSLLRTFINKSQKETPDEKLMEAQQELGAITKLKGHDMDAYIGEALNQMQKQVEQVSEQAQQPVQLTEPQKGKFIIKYLKEQGILDEVEHGTFIYKVENDLLNFEQLIDELKTMHIVQVAYPMSTSVEGILDDFGAQNPAELAGFIDDVRDSKKGLGTLTATPIKSFIPGSLVLSIGIIVIMGVVVIGQNPDIINNLIGGGIKLPGLFIKSLLHM